jgi:SecD/SecF fusion protein
VKYRWIYLAISLVLILGSFVTMGINSSAGRGAFNYSLEFVGGTTTTVTFNENYSQQEIENQIIPYIVEATGVSTVQQQKVTDSNDVIFKTSSLTLEQREAFAAVMEEQFGVAEDSISAENISATVGSEMRKDAMIAVLIATVCMLIYIWFRFSSFNFAGSAILALVHDVLIVVGFYAVSRISVGNTFIACVLTILGYSINATIVIFDRIRENNRESAKASLEEIVNESITQTLSRSINTSLTTFVMLLVLYVMGVSSIKEFSLPLMVGVLSGAYSSVCLSGTIWYTFETMKKKKTEKKA